MSGCGHGHGNSAESLDRTANVKCRDPTPLNTLFSRRPFTFARGAAARRLTAAVRGRWRQSVRAGCRPTPYCRPSFTKPTAYAVPISRSTPETASGEARDAALAASSSSVSNNCISEQSHDDPGPLTENNRGGRAAKLLSTFMDVFANTEDVRGNRPRDVHGWVRDELTGGLARSRPAEAGGFGHHLAVRGSRCDLMGSCRCEKHPSSIISTEIQNLLASKYRQFPRAICK